MVSRLRPTQHDDPKLHAMATSQFALSEAEWDALFANAPVVDLRKEGPVPQRIKRYTVSTESQQG
ncbi:hypothetical protein SAMN05421543_106109 [Alicyclobacillus macrosporangiidus]|uniref:Uncharacterized protein n=1 Tax=Alicyclobacillus macrosporangiidus TaxID=392015 RepID=A0A1I7IB08_9BACL|nr:hypothetical protein SAMN05421543_106109 [Alicyclobacillus macrosporangiidus]